MSQPYEQSDLERELRRRHMHVEAGSVRGLERRLAQAEARVKELENMGIGFKAQKLAVDRAEQAEAERDRLRKALRQICDEALSLTEAKAMAALAGDKQP